MLGMAINMEEMYVCLSICLLLALDIKMKWHMDFIDSGELLSKKKRNKCYSLQPKLVLISFWPQATGVRRATEVGHGTGTTQSWMELTSTLELKKKAESTDLGKSTFEATET
jgi:hypothetical protein